MMSFLRSLLTVCEGSDKSPVVLSEMEQKRQQHIQELINTEETYTKDLVTVLEVNVE
jgi:hypothetical protein